MHLSLRIAALLGAFSSAALLVRWCAGVQARFFSSPASPARDEGAEAQPLLRALRGLGLTRLAAVVEPIVPSAVVGRLAVELRRAHLPGDPAAAEIIAIAGLCAAASLIAALLFWLGGAMSIFWLPLATLSGAAAPLVWLRDRVRTRGRVLVRALPYALDLLTLSVEAGLDFAAAIAKTVEKGRTGPLGEELGLAIRELKVGRTREEALRAFAARVRLPPVNGLVAALVQADRMGTPLGKVLRILASQMREERTQRAEKLAGEAPVKLLLPLIGCIFPTIFLILFGPIAFQIASGQ